MIVDFPIPGAPPSSTSDPGTGRLRACPVELMISHEPAEGGRLHLPRGTGRTARPVTCRIPPAVELRRAAGADRLLDEGVPFAASRAPAVPFRALVPALGAGEDSA